MVIQAGLFALAQATAGSVSPLLVAKVEKSKVQGFPTFAAGRVALESVSVGAADATLGFER
jgi:hypothetical protein